ncbi:MAG: phosphoribosylformylglycinamidine cyclo-ligase [Chloroflexota bacterium]
MTRLSDAYSNAGVDVEAADRAIAQARRSWPMAAADRFVGLSEFGAVTQLPSDMEQPLIVTSTDGVGTKTEIARLLNRYDTIGQDLVAMCADDVVCHGAQPTYFLDYIAVGKVHQERVSALIGGVAKACAEIGCVLVGGETAEHPGTMADDAFDLAGFCAGFVEQKYLIDRGQSREGDAILGLASSGLHSNGFSLIRKLIDEHKLPLTADLLEPTRLYSQVVLDVADAVRGNHKRIGGLAHITGGGLRRNIPRALPDNLTARIRPVSWSQPPIFDKVAVAAGMTDQEMRATFNCGIGFAIVLEPGAVEIALDVIRDADIEAWEIGIVGPTHYFDGERYVEA